MFEILAYTGEQVDEIYNNFCTMPRYDCWYISRIPGKGIHIMVEPDLIDYFTEYLQSQRLAFHILIENVQR